MLGLGVWFVSNIGRVTTHETTDGVVVDLIVDRDSDGDVVYAPVYEYEVNGETYRYTSAISYGGLAVPDIGDRKTILYNPDDPWDARVNNRFLLIWLPLMLMLIPILIAVGVFWGTRRRQSPTTEPPWAAPASEEQPDWPASHPAPDPFTLEPLRTTIDAMFMGTEPSPMDDQGRVRYRVKARAEIDGEVHRFRSEWMDEDPTLYYMQHGNKVDVRIDPDDPAQYEVILPAS